MRPGLKLAGLVLGISLMCSGLPQELHAATVPGPRDDTVVAIAQDQTAEADCKVWVDSPANERPCDPGSVIFVRTTTYRAAKASGMTDYAFLTGNVARDQQLQDTLADTVHQRIKAAHVANDVQPMACWSHVKRINGSYLSIPSDSTSTRMSYQVNYQVWADCSITWVQDQSSTNGPHMKWLQSCSNGTANCSRRDILVGGNWTAWQGMLNTRADAEYRHLSAAPCWNCGMPYGYTRFVQ